MVRKTFLWAGLLVLLVLAAGCKKEAPPPMPPQLTAEQHFNQGLMLYQQENFQSAAMEFEQATYMRANYVEAYDYLGRCYWKQNMLQRAEQSFVQAVNLQPSYLPARVYLGLLYYVMNSMDLARQQLEAARGLGSVDPAVYTALGDIYLDQNRCSDAMASYKRALALDSGYLKANQGLDRARMKCGGKSQKTKKQAPPKPTPKTEFKGGGKALNPADF